MVIQKLGRNLSCIKTWRPEPRTRPVLVDPLDQNVINVEGKALKRGKTLSLLLHETWAQLTWVHFKSSIPVLYLQDDRHGLPPESGRTGVSQVVGHFFDLAHRHSQPRMFERGLEQCEHLLQSRAVFTAQLGEYLRVNGMVECT